MNADGSKPTPFTDQQGEEANWSPDGTKIAFASTGTVTLKRPTQSTGTKSSMSWRQTVQT